MPEKIAANETPTQCAADVVRSGMLVEVMPGDAPMRVDRSVRTTHNGRPCVKLVGVQRAPGGGVEPVEVYVGPDHTVRPWPPRTVAR